MLVKYYPNGKEKPENEAVISCKNCKNGENFLDKLDKRAQLHAAKTFEPICGSCNTKYIIPLKDENKMLRKSCDGCSFNIGVEYCPVADDSMLCVGSVEYFHKIIEDDINIEGDNMEGIDENFSKDKIHFVETGVCNNHRFIKSNSFKTFEGTFQLVCCPICKIGKVDYKNKVHEDNVFKLVNFLADEGIKADRKEAERMSKFAELGKETVQESNFVPLIPQTQQNTDQYGFI